MPSNFAARLAWGIQIGTLAVLGLALGPTTTGDSSHYLALARALRERGEFGLPFAGAFESEGWRQPGYPLFLAVVQAFFGTDNPWPVVLIQATLVLASVWLVHHGTQREFGPRAGLVFLWLSAAYPFVLAHAFLVSPEAVAALVVALGVLLLGQPTPGRALAAGLLLGSATYLRPNILPLSGVLALALVACNRRHAPAALGLVAGAALVLAPWILRNHGAFGAATPLPPVAGFGRVLLIATWQGRVDQEAITAYTSGHVTEGMAQSGLLEQARAVNETIGAAPDTILGTGSYAGNRLKARADRELRATALRNIRDRPLLYARTVGENLARLWFSYRFPKPVPPALRLLLVAEGILALVAGVAGVCIALRRDRPGVVVAAATLGFFAASLCWFQTEARYTIPARLWLLSFAAVALTRRPRLRRQRGG